MHYYLAVLLSTCWRVICTRLHFMLFDGSIFSAGFLTHTHTHTNTKKKVGDFSVYVNIKTVRVKNQTNTHTTTTHTNTHQQREEGPTTRSSPLGKKLFLCGRCSREGCGERKINVRLLICNTTNKCPLNVTHR